MKPVSAVWDWLAIGFLMSLLFGVIIETKLSDGYLCFAAIAWVMVIGAFLYAVYIRPRLMRQNETKTDKTYGDLDRDR